MKAKCIAQKTNKSYKFFLLMIVPLLIGAMIALTSFSHAKWDEKDASLCNPPFSKVGQVQGK
jgi:hypothetical protein